MPSWKEMTIKRRDFKNSKQDPEEMKHKRSDKIKKYVLWYVPNIMSNEELIEHYKNTNWWNRQRLKPFKIEKYYTIKDAEQGLEAFKKSRNRLYDNVKGYKLEILDINKKPDIDKNYLDMIDNLEKTI